jgi:hypothetical protein
LSFCLHCPEPVLTGRHFPFFHDESLRPLAFKSVFAPFAYGVGILELPHFVLFVVRLRAFDIPARDIIILCQC